MTGREFHSGAASRSNTEDASIRLKRTKLNFNVLVHATEQQLA
jgi:hypothetical protein